MIRERFKIVEHPLGVFSLTLISCCLAAVLGSLFGIVQGLNWNDALGDFCFAATLGLLIGILGTGPVAIAGIIVSREWVWSTVLSGSGLLGFCSWILSLGITAMKAA